MASDDAPPDRLALARGVLLRDLIESLPDLVFFKDTESVFLGCNRAFARFYGHPEEQIIGKTDFDFVPPDVAEMFRAHDAAMLAQGATRINEETVHAADGTLLHLETLKTPLRDAEGNIRGLIGIARDIGERRRFRAELEAMNADLERRVAERTAELSAANERLSAAMAQLVEAEKLAALGSLVAGVAHELNTPLGNALTVATTLQARVAAFEAALASPNGLKKSTLAAFLEDARAATDLLARSHERASRLVARFKAIAVDQTSERRRPFDLGECLEDLAATVTPELRGAGISIATEGGRGLVLDSYPGPLDQVLLNLVQNARIHAFPVEGRPAIISMRATDGGSDVLLEVRDNGRGMPEAVSAHAFEPFFTTRLGSGGSGLGLAITHNLVRGVLGGEIHLTTSPAGTTFSLRLPKTAPRREEPNR